MPELSFIKAHTLDDTRWLDPKMHIYCDSKAQWTLILMTSRSSKRCLLFSLERDLHVHAPPP